MHAVRISPRACGSWANTVLERYWPTVFLEHLGSLLTSTRFVDSRFEGSLEEEGQGTFDL